MVEIKENYQFDLGVKGLITSTSGWLYRLEVVFAGVMGNSVDLLFKTVL